MLKNVSLNVIITASGTRGDVQPYIALALSLNARGHKVFIATEERMKGLVVEFGLNYRRLAGDPAGLIFEFDPKVQEVLRKGQMFKLITLTQEWDKKFDRRDVLDSYVSACEGADLIISSGLTMTQSLSVAQKMSIAWIPLILGPTLETRWVKIKISVIFKKRYKPIPEA